MEEFVGKTVERVTYNSMARADEPILTVLVEGGGILEIGVHQGKLWTKSSIPSAGHRARGRFPRNA